MTRFLVAAVSILLLSVPRTAAAACSAFGGRATVVQANALGVVPVVLSDTGNLDSTGGAKEAALLNTSVPGLATAEVMHATAVGQDNYSRSEASVASLNLTMLGNTISADFLMARANANCGTGGATVGGSSEIAGLVVNGQSVVVTGSPNQTISLPGGVMIILNEQVSSVQGGNGSISVNALHVTAPGVADALVSTALAVIGPLLVVGGGGGGGNCEDFVTGGGWITKDGAKGNFGVAGGIRKGEFWGHLEYIDHGKGMKVKGTGVTAYTSDPDPIANPNTRIIQGTADIDGESGTYTVKVTDNGEPGRGDVFMISLSNEYMAGGTLDGGNIQLHKPCP